MVCWRAQQRIIWAISFSLLLTLVLIDGCFRCGADPCQHSFNSSRAVSLHCTMCRHYAAYTGRPPVKWSLPQAFDLPSKKARMEGRNEAPTAHATPSHSASSWHGHVPTESSTEDASDPHSESLQHSHVLTESNIVDAPDPQAHTASTDGPNIASSHRPVHTRRLPARFRDTLPEPPLSVPIQPPPVAVIPRVILHVFDSFRTAFNTFGIA